VTIPSGNVASGHAIARARLAPLRTGVRDSARRAPWTVASVAAAAFLFVVVGRLHDAIAEGAIPAGKLLYPVAILALMTAPTMGMIRQMLGTPQGKAFLLFGAAIFISLPFSLLRFGTTEIAIDFIIRTVPLVLAVVVGLRSLADVERLMRLFALMVVFVGMLFVGGFGVTGQGPDVARSVLTGAYDPNDWALLMATGAAFALRSLSDRALLWRATGAAGLVCAMYVIYLTGSRGGAVSAAVMIAASLLIARRAVPRWLRLSLIPAIVLALSFAPSQYIGRLASITNVEEDYNVTESSGRTQIWKRGFGYFVSRPLTGVGAGQFGQAEGRYGVEELGLTSAWKWSAAHNMYVEAAAEMGLPGLFAVLGMLVPSITLWRRVRRRQPRTEAEFAYQRAVETMAIGVVTFMSGAVFLSATFSPLLLLLMIFGIALRVVPEARLSGQVGSRPALPPPNSVPNGPRRGRMASRHQRASEN
jgi:putative inorganic carbon (hco3(-)) transporter